MAGTDSQPRERVANANEGERNRGEMHVEAGEKPKISPTETDVASASSAPAQTLYKEYATRVAQVMRTYLGGGAVGTAGGSARAKSGNVGGDCCKAMMEVVRKRHGKWVVTKLETEHNHAEDGSILQNPGDENMASAPKIGMEFESVEDAKVFYSEYGEKIGFQTRTGSNRRSSSSGALTMQRFVCYKGDYKMGTGSNAGRVRRVFRKKLTENDEDGPVAGRTRGSKSKAEVVELESSGEDEEETESDEGRVSKGKKGKKGKKKKRVASSGIASGAGGSLLYRLIRVPHNNNEERRKILLKYLNKRRNRGLLGRPGKIASRQAVAERRKRGKGGEFLSADGSKTPGKSPGRRSGKKQTEVTPSGQVAAVPAYTLMYWPVYSYQGLAGSGTSTSTPARPRPRSQPRVLTYKENETPEPDPAEEITAEPGGEPQVGMIFENEEKAHDFYSKYAMKIGFTIRKGWWDRAGRSVTKSRSFVCSKEGYRPRSNSSNPKRPPPETRTNCGAHMTIKITVSGKYVVTEFVAHHNHELEPLLMDIQALRKQNLLAKVVRTPRLKEKEKEQAIVVHQEKEKENENEIENPVFIPDEYKNYIRSKLVTKMPQGDAGVICEYMQKVKGENPNFFYSVQLDETDQVTNVFWADAKSINDYHHFGDVVCFDTRYKVHNYGRPLALFVGLNHHRHIVIFGMALMYDESLASYKWLFETFKSAMYGKQPKTLLTDQDDAMSESISAIWPGTAHRLSVLHIYQKASIELEHVVQSSNHFLAEFAQCLNGFSEEVDLLSAWDLLLDKYDLKDNEWMKKLYTEKEKWASLYARDVFTADISATLQGDNMTLTLKEYLKPEIGILACLKQLELFVDERRFQEQQADYLAGQGVPRGHNNYRVLWQAMNVYTPSVFNLFKHEFDLFVMCTAFTCGEAGSVSEYQVTLKERPPGYFVRFDSSDLSAMCTCKKFESTGIPCCHILRIFDLRNIKELPSQYILHRWRKDAKLENLRENHGLGFDDDPRSSLAKRYGSLCRILYRVAARAAENQEGYLFMQNQAAQLIDQVEKVLQARVMDKGASGGALKGMQHILGSGEGTSGETKRKKKSSSKRQNNGVDASSAGSKRKKARQGVLDDHQLAIRADEPPPPTNEIPAAPARNVPPPFLTPSQLMQSPYMTNPQFALGSMQGFHGMTQFSQMQDSSAALQQQTFHSTTQMTQAIPPAPDMQSLQFLGNNPQLVGTNPQMVGNNQQLGHQNTDQAHYTIPVWDFL